MFQKLSLQYIFSYFGLLPFFYILIDKYYFYQIKEEIILDFLINYCLIIFVFIGSTNWNFSERIKNHIIIYGFLPSLFAFVIILLNLLNYNPLSLILLIIFLLTIQLIFDYFFIYNTKINKRPFYFLRLPLTIIIVVIIILITN
tara:strand:- start:1720 stop:2151 length:432 start_codon:yes stop_codon:yes gene_type:complete